MFPGSERRSFTPFSPAGFAAAQIDVIVWAGLSRRPPQNAKSLRPRQLKRRSKKDLRPRGRFYAQGPQVVPSHLGNPIAENLDPRHGDSDIAPVLRQSFIFFLCSRHSSTLKVNIGRALGFFFSIFVKKQTDASVRRSEVIWFKPHLKRTPRYADWRSFGEE